MSRRNRGRRRTTRDCVELWGECYNIDNTTNLYLQSSGLTGEIPPEIGYLVNLEHMYLHHNQLTGELPEELGYLVNLRTLSLGSNQFTGTIPYGLQYLDLYSIDINSSQLSGGIPSWLFTELPNLNSLGLNQNQLSGQIPYAIENGCASGMNIKLFGNNLCPPYPECLTEQEVGYQDTSNCVDSGGAGCMDPNCFNYDQGATIPGNCYGCCTDPPCGFTPDPNPGKGPPRKPIGTGIAREGGEIRKTTTSRFSGRTQNNPKGKPRK